MTTEGSKVTLDLSRWHDAAAWDQWVAASPQHSVFANSAFIDALKVDVHRWVLSRNGEPQAAALVLARQGQVIRAPHPYTMYQGVFYPGWAAQLPPHRRSRWEIDMTTELLQGLSRHYDSLSFCLHPSITDIRAFQWFNYHAAEQGQFAVSLRYTGRLATEALADPAAYMASMRDSRRYDCRKAAKAGLTVEPSNDIGVLELLYGRTLERQGQEFPEVYRRLLRQIAGAALAGNFGELLICRNPAGEALSASLFLQDARSAYWLFGGNDPDGRDTGSGTFLLVEGIKRAHARGAQWVDFCGVNSPNRGDFKTSFNAEVHPYIEAHWSRPFPLATLEQGR